MKPGDRVAVTGYFAENFPPDVVDAVRQGTSSFSHMSPYEKDRAAIRVPGKGFIYMPYTEAFNMHHEWQAIQRERKTLMQMSQGASMRLWNALQSDDLRVTIKKAVFDLDRADLDPTLSWSDYATIVRSVANDLRKHINE
jgi:hypothetical protein